jgi:hypothetical protein
VPGLRYSATVQVPAPAKAGPWPNRSVRTEARGPAPEARGASWQFGVSTGPIRTYRTPRGRPHGRTTALSRGFLKEPLTLRHRYIRGGRAGRAWQDRLSPGGVVSGERKAHRVTAVPRESPQWQAVPVTAYATSSAHVVVGVRQAVCGPWLQEVTPSSTSRAHRRRRSAFEKRRVNPILLTNDCAMNA